jgi:hypothetical protein
MGERNDHTGNKPRSARGDVPTGTSHKFQGLAELADSVFTSGAGRSDKFRKTHEAVAEFAGRTIMNEMYVLVLNGTEATFPEPNELDPKEAQGSKLERYRILLKQALEKQDKYDTSKGLTFRLILGQCHPVLKQKLESNATFPNLQTTNDVAGLMKLLKSLVYSTDSNQYEFWSMQASLSKLVNLTQLDTEGLASYGKRFLAQLEATEEVNGFLIPDKYRTKTAAEQQVARGKLLACMFLAGADRRRYKPVIDELNNDFLRGKTTYPEDIESMSLLMSNYRGHKSDTKLDAYNDGVILSQTSVVSDKKKKKKKKKKSRPTTTPDVEEDDDDEEDVRELLREASRGITWTTPG